MSFKQVLLISLNSQLVSGVAARTINQPSCRRCEERGVTFSHWFCSLINNTFVRGSLDYPSHGYTDGEVIADFIYISIKINKNFAFLWKKKLKFLRFYNNWTARI